MRPSGEQLFICCLQARAERCYDQSMRKVVLISLFLFAVGISIYFAEDQKRSEEDMEKTIKASLDCINYGPAVYATREIKKGEIVTADALETRLLEVNKMPDHIIYLPADAVGRRSIYRITKGQLLSMFDFPVEEFTVKDCAPNWRLKPRETTTTNVSHH